MLFSSFAAYNGVVEGDDDHLGDSADISDRRGGATSAAETVGQLASSLVTGGYQVGILVEATDHFVTIVTAVVITCRRIFHRNHHNAFKEILHITESKLTVTELAFVDALATVAR